jgi:hypothetical protein
VPPELGPVVDAAAYGQTIVVCQDGTVRAWGRDDHGQCQVPVGLGHVSAVVAGVLNSAVISEYPLPICPGDIAYNRSVDGADLGTLLTNWGPVTDSVESADCDLDKSGTVGGSDLGILLANWGPCPN